ncbi:hypothetical protein [Actinomadura alba]|uniref:MYXO-CTERM domain-containing protein n=1 Tax=Actinomadura alba TaxID=406431 RepID=A0ABR7LQD3_9ACTN|nr:hypothetical protein [Actinomadura alba]MBC6466878.1 hypothetical protein [Actinomadura alba]
MSWILTVVLLAGSGYCLTGAITQGTATRRAAAGEGRPGTFVAENRRCSKSCSWYGTFTADGEGRIDDREIELRGGDEDSIEAGQRVRVLNVGPFVQARGGPPEWGSTIANSMGTFVLAVLGLAGLAGSLARRSRSRRSVV